MTRVKIAVDELYPHFYVIVPGADPEVDEFTTYADKDMYEVDEDTLKRWAETQNAFCELRAELRAIHEARNRMR